MIRPLRDEVGALRSLLARAGACTTPVQWGSKRTGPDLARVGAKYSDDGM